jgi:O-antigen ligase
MKPLRVLSAMALSTLAAAFFLTLLASLTAVPGMPLFTLAGLAGLVVLALVRPEHALVALAIGIPIASWIGRQLAPGVAWPETLAVAFCAGYCARGIRIPRRDPAPSSDAIAPPLFVAVAVIVASLVLQLLIDAWRFGEASTMAELWRLVRSGYFVTATASDPIDAAMRLLESLILFRAAVTVTRRVPQFGTRLTVWIVIGASVAAALNLVRLWEGAARLEAPLAAFVRYLLTFRLNVHYADVNAAGSYFVAMLFIALGLACAPKGRAWSIAVVLIASSLWLSGSRMAYIAGVLSILLPAIVFSARITRVGVRGTVLTAAALALAVLAGAAAYAIPARGNQKSPLTAFTVRWELALTSVRMLSTSPVFGVGIGRYYSRSGEFSSPELLRLFPPAVHENAHNNFLQLLAELGIVGFAAMLWLLGTAARLATRLVRAGPRDPMRWGLVLGALAFVLTWLGGHPLLIDEPAMTFWIVLGLISGWGESGAAAASAVRSFSLATVLVIATAISVPVRFVQQRADFDLNHRGVGLSPWQDAIDGVRYRLAQATSSVFVPSDARLIVVPLRAAASRPELRVQMLLDGRPADIVTVSPERWQLLRIQIPQERRAPRFHRLELKVDGAPADTDLLMIGKIEPR